MKWLLIVLAVAAIASVALVIFVRSVGHDPVRWHVDPATVTEIEERNQFLGRHVFEGPIPLADVLSQFVSDLPRVERIAGDVADGWVTYVERTPLVGYPDYISVRMDTVDEGSNPRSRIAIYSRSRFGYSDLGANRKRVEAWIENLKKRVE